MEDAGRTGESGAKAKLNKSESSKKEGGSREAEAEESQRELAFKEAEGLRSFSLYRFEGSQSESAAGQNPKPIRMGIFIRILKTAQDKGRNKNNQFCDRLNGLRRAGTEQARSSEQERRVDAMALIADEGRDKLR